MWGGVHGLVALGGLTLATAAPSSVFGHAPVPSNHWVSKAISVRGGADAAPEQTEILTEVQLARASFKDILGDKLLTVDNAKKGTTKEVSTKETLDGKHTAIYFSSKAVEEQLEKASQGQETVRPTPVVKEAYNKALASGKELEVVYVPVADAEEAYIDQFKDMPWKGIVHSNATIANLIRKAEIRVLPAVLVLDEQGEVVTKDGYSNMVFFSEDFPWKNKGLREMLGDKFIKSDGTTVGQEALDGKVLALYFSAGWCAPCKQFTPILMDVYKKLQEQGKPFELVFLSSDKSQEEFDGYSSNMPWISVPYDGKTRTTVSQLLGVTALPTLLVFDEESKLITANGRVEILKDPEGAGFPWYPKPMSELSESPEVITQKPAFIFFMEGGEKDEQARIKEVLQPLAEARSKLAEGGQVRDAGFLTASEIDPLATAFRKLCGLEEVQGKFKFMKSKKDLLKPKMALLDLMKNQYAVSDAEELTEDSIAAFVGAWDAGELETTEFDIPSRPEEGEDFEAE